MAYVTLDGYTVARTTDRSIGIMKGGEPPPRGYIKGLLWLPKQFCREGDELSLGDTDIEVAQWLADREGLDY